MAASCADLDGPLCGTADCRSCWKKLNDSRDHFKSWRAANNVPEPNGNRVFFGVSENAVDLKPILEARASRQKELLEKGGPGSVMQTMLKELVGVEEWEGCSCRAMVARMNEWGTGCLDHLEEITAAVKTNAVNLRLDAKIKAELPELWERFDEVVEGLVREAVRQTSEDN